MSELSQRLARKLERFMSAERPITASGKFSGVMDNQRDSLPLSLEPSFLQSLEPSELNRLFLLISDRNGKLSTSRQRVMQPYLEELPPRPVRRLENKDGDQLAVRRSHLIDQFFSHRMHGLKSEGSTAELSREQARLRDAALQSSEILKMAVEKLADAFPEVPKSTLGYDREIRVPPDESRVLKCPTKYMEGSVAVVLEHTEHITMNITRDGDLVNEM